MMVGEDNGSLNIWVMNKASTMQNSNSDRAGAVQQPQPQPQPSEVWENREEKIQNLEGQNTCSRTWQVPAVLAVCASLHDDQKDVLALPALRSF